MFLAAVRVDMAKDIQWKKRIESDAMECPVDYFFVASFNV